jgi:hypothetical protein
MDKDLSLLLSIGISAAIGAMLGILRSKIFAITMEAESRVRGRIIKVDGVNKLLVFIKIRPGIYQAVETDTGNTSGALYNNIWDLAWSLRLGHQMINWRLIESFFKTNEQ